MGEIRSILKDHKWNELIIASVYEIIDDINLTMGGNANIMEDR